MNESTVYQVHIPVFDGPFDLLLHLIKENQVDIYDIPIAIITDQYLAYLDQMKHMDLEIASSFLVMAATLLALKAKTLLPKPILDDDEEEKDIRSDLVHDLLEYMRFKEAAQTMDQLAIKQRQHFARPNDEELYLNLFSEENPLNGKTLSDLQLAFAKILQKAESQGIVMHIEREQITLPDRMEHLYLLIKEKPQGIAFSSIFSENQSKICLIVTFLALLELIRQTVIKIAQGDNYQEIYLYAGDLNKYDQ